MEKLSCLICGNAIGNRVLIAKEMMFGSRDEFEYLECAQCGCLQISNPPKEMSKYYPSDYYTPESVSRKALSKRERVLGRFAENGLIGSSGIFVVLLGILYPNSSLPKSLRRARVTPNSRILEVGCGQGALLLTFRKWGFKNVAGVDPYCHTKTHKDLTIINTDFDHLPEDGKFECIIFDHSFEHIANQQATIDKVSRFLSNEGFCILRIPVKSDYIWHRYGVDWVQLDAPRHFFLHTFKSLAILTKKSGLIMEDAIFDSTEFQFWGSELYKRGIPLKTLNSQLINPIGRVFTTKDLAEYRKLAAKLNRIREGDQASFIFRKKPL